VIEREAAQEILVGFAFAAVLADDEAGCDLEHLADPQSRRRVDHRSRHRQLACGLRRRACGAGADAAAAGVVFWIGAVTVRLGCAGAAARGGARRGVGGFACTVTGGIITSAGG
jgi:hypothetical protein